MRIAQLSKEEKIIIAALIVVSVIAWVFTVQHSQGMSSDACMANEPILLGGLVFLTMWTVMMVAMMFPAIVPMVLMFTTVQNKSKEREQKFIPTWVFIAGYLIIWSLIGILAFAVVYMIDYITMNSSALRQYGHIISGAVLILAGLYQLTPYKNFCLTHCRSPLNFIMNKWKDGYLGSLVMGMDHGLYCLGCCWGLMAVLIVLGVMNITWMGVLTLVIFIEKVSERGVLISKFVGGLLILFGAFMALRPMI